MDRRGFMAGALGTAIVPGAVRAGALFAGTPLAANGVARYFQSVPPGTHMPDVTLDGDNGSRHHLSELTGKTRLVTIWAEWCAPCLVEAGDLARLYARYGGPHFEVLSVLSDSRRRLDVKAAREVLEKTHAQALPLWVEPDGGEVVAASLTGAHGATVSLPCTLLVDRTGAVKGRMSGLVLAPGSLPRNGQSVWTTPDADRFIQALSRDDTRAGDRSI